MIYVERSGSMLVGCKYNTTLSIYWRKCVFTQISNSKRKLVFRRAGGLKAVWHVANEFVVSWNFLVSIFLSALLESRHITFLIAIHSICESIIVGVGIFSEVIFNSFKTSGTILHLNKAVLSMIRWRLSRLNMETQNTNLLILKSESCLLSGILSSSSSLFNALHEFRPRIILMARSRRDFNRKSFSFFQKFRLVLIKGRFHKETNKIYFYLKVG